MFMVMVAISVPKMQLEGLRIQAVKHGAAHWEVADDGSTTFRWNDEKAEQPARQEEPSPGCPGPLGTIGMPARCPNGEGFEPLKGWHWIHRCDPDCPWTTEEAK